MKRSEIEIMAPVGSYESLRAAIQGGANSIYFGIEQLNMRAKSSVSGRAVFECTEEQFTGELLAILGLDPTRAKVLLDPREPSLAEDVHSLWRTKASNHHGNSNRLAHPVSSTWSNLFGRM